MEFRNAEQLGVECNKVKSAGFWRRRSKLEKALLTLSVVALLACAALAGVMVLVPSLRTSILHEAKYADESSSADQSADGEHGQKSTKLPTTKGRGPSGEEYEICNTQECILAAATLIDAMDSTADPCSNFYQFACGGWMEKNPVPETSSYWSQFDLLELQLNKALSDILTSPIIEADPKPVNQAKYFYSACMKEEALETLGVTPLSDFLGTYGGWPITLGDWNESSFDWQTTVADARRLMGKEYIISVSVYADLKNTDATTIYIDQTSLGMTRSVLTEPEKYEDRIRAYKTYMTDTASLIATAFGVTPNETQIQTEVNATIDFETALASITTPVEDRRDLDRMYNNMTITEISNMTSGLIDWSKLLSSMFSTAGVSIDVNQRVIVSEIEYFKKLSDLLSATSLRTVSNYLMWRFVADLGDETNKKMRDVSFQYRKVTSGITSQKIRSERCANEANKHLGIAIGTKYMETHFAQEAKDDASNMVEGIREAFKDLLENNEWMDEATKPKAVEKVDAISKFIAYPDWYGNNSALEHYYHGLADISAETHFVNIKAISLWKSTKDLAALGSPTRQDSWVYPPTIVNAHYNLEFNSITFAAGIFQPPFYRTNSLKALNYGSIGQVIGHEITHGFDDQGRQNDKDGNTVPWWSNATLEAFKRKAECIVNQYGNVSVPDVAELLPNATLNGITTQGENIADNGGLREAYMAYLKYVDRVGEEPRLPGIDNFTPLQLFFLANGNMWCGTETQRGLLNQILTEAHSPIKYRVMVPMSNMKPFSDVWNCSSSAPMNPTHKCVVW